jgi:2-oxoisovalerate dehydrogenase E1 component alpha subunit
MSAYTESFSDSLMNPSPAERSTPTYRAVDGEGRVLDSEADKLLSDEALTRIWKNTVTIRAFDTIMEKLQRQGRFSFFMTQWGEESSLFGLGEALKSGDVVFGQYREQALLFHLGKSMADIMSSYFTTRSDAMKGRQMPQTMGLSNAPIKFVTMKASLGEQIPQASGSAYAMKRKGLKNVVACVFGDGCSSEGDFAVGLNMAATTKSPVIFFVRNNGYAISTPAVGQQYLGDGVAPRGPAYGVPAIRVDGTDLAAVHKACTFARDHCLSSPDAGPFLIEAMTCRLGAHSTSDEQKTYRSQEEIDAGWRSFDCVEKLRNYLQSRNLQSVVDNFTSEQASKLVLDAIASVEEEQPPYIDWLFEDVFDKVEGKLPEQMAELRELWTKYGNEGWQAKNDWQWKDESRS